MVGVPSSYGHSLSHSLKTHGVRFSASPLSRENWEFLTSFGVKAAGLSLCVSEWSPSFLAKGSGQKTHCVLARLITWKMFWKKARKITARLYLKLNIHPSLAC